MQSQYQREYVKYVVRNKRINRFVKALVKVGIKRKKAIIILVERQKHVRKLGKLLQEFSPQLIYGPVKQDQRKKIIKKFEAGKYNLIIASVVFTKGVSVNRIDMVIDCAQRKSKNDAMQKLGRGVRLHKNKKFLLYFDIYSSAINSLVKAATSRRTAFKRAKIPFIAEKVKAKDLEQEAERLLALGEAYFNE